MTANGWIPDDVPLDKPSPARIYDYLLGGSHNFEVDRLTAEKVITVNPDARLIMHANRAFLRRVVRFLIEQGIDQFLDIGSGIPTVGNVHEVAQAVNPSARIIYVDIDPVAVRHSEAILEDNPNAVVVQADARQPDQIMSHPEIRRLLDLSRPAAVLLIALLHFVTNDQEAFGLVRILRDALAPGSYLAISHATNESLPREVVEQSEKLYERSTNPAKARSRAQIERFFDGLELLEPGLVYAPLWRPESPDDLFLDQPERSANLVGVGYKL
jgi:hypothetical protein